MSSKSTTKATSKPKPVAENTEATKPAMPRQTAKKQGASRKHTPTNTNKQKHPESGQ
jgi:hypothetical protein